MGNTLADHKLHYEDIPRKNNYNKITKTRKGGKDSKMSKATTNEAPKTVKKYAKTRGEHFKDLVIVALVTAIIAFVAGAIFQDRQNNAVETARNAVTPSASAETPVKK